MSDSQLVAHAKRELKAAGLFDKDSDYEGGLGESVLELVNKFAEQGHSGASAAMTTQLFSKVASYEALSPLTGEDDEWNQINDGIDGDIKYQNKRDGRVFKHADGRVTFNDAIIWRGDIGGDFSGSVEGISSIAIKGFPFTPKTFYIDVSDYRYIKNEDGSLTEDPEGDWWEHEIKDRGQLEEVWEYYLKPEEPSDD